MRNLHAAFHQEAAKVIEWATSGRKQLAEQAFALGGSYTRASAALTEAMVRWRDKRD